MIFSNNLQKKTTPVKKAGRLDPSGGAVEVPFDITIVLSKDGSWEVKPNSSDETGKNSCLHKSSFADSLSRAIYFCPLTASNIPVEKS